MHAHLEPGTEPRFKQAPVLQLESIKNRETGKGKFPVNTELIFKALAIPPLSNNNIVLSKALKTWQYH